MEARRAHNPEVVGSSPASATKKDSQPQGWLSFLVMGKRLEEGGLATGKAKKCPGDTSLAGEESINARRHPVRMVAGIDLFARKSCRKNMGQLPDPYTDP